jgi:hypothetical protein
MQFEEWASKNLKHRYFSLIERLRGKEEIADTCTIPFVPYVGSSYSDAKHKILIIGKATYGWGKGDEGQGSGALNDVLDKDDHDLWRHLVELPEEFIEGEIIPYYGERKGDPQGPSREEFISLRANFCWIVRSRMSGTFRCRRRASSP